MKTCPTCGHKMSKEKKPKPDPRFVNARVWVSVSICVRIPFKKDRDGFTNLDEATRAAKSRIRRALQDARIKHSLRWEETDAISEEK
jgi:hypothetical protein